jgi:hypothetical protein
MGKKTRMRMAARKKIESCMVKSVSNPRIVASG